MNAKLICFYVMSLCELIGCILIFVYKEKSFSKARFKLTKKGFQRVKTYFFFFVKHDLMYLGGCALKSRLVFYLD
jgi:hypothetical protein